MSDDKEATTSRLVEPYRFVRELPFWRVHTWDLTAGGPRTYRLDRMRSARLTGEAYEPRPDYDPSYMRNPRIAKVWWSPAVARFQVERGARPLADGSALSDLSVGSADWLEVEILSHGGEAVVLEPIDLRKRIAERARALARELHVERLRVAT